MKKIKLFSGDNLHILEKDINRWLAKNKGISIINANLTAAARTGETYTFYILYTGNAETAMLEVKEMLEETTISNISPAIAENLSQQEEDPTISNQLKN
jgi:precorrin isomerase